MSNAFDIEKAKAGEPVEYQIGCSRWVAVNFVSMSWHRANTAIIEWIEGPDYASDITFTPITSLRMAPKKVKVRYRNYKMCDPIHAAVSMICDGPGWDTPDEIETKPWFRGWIHDEWQEAEVEQ